MKARPYSAWISRLYIFAMAALAFTGFMQMPLAQRYALVEIPGMAWTGDFFFVHKFHYILAAGLLFLLGVVCMNWLLEWKDKIRLTPLGKARVALVGAIVISGGLRVYRNLPDVTPDPAFIVTVEWIHFGSVMVLGGVALAALVRKASAYVRLK